MIDAALNLLNMIDTALILSGTIGCIALIFARLQHVHQKKTTSVNISMEMLKRFREDDFRKTVRFLNTNELPNDKWDKNKELLKLLNHFEEMGLFEKDKLLSTDHIVHLHGHVLKLIKNNECAKKLIRDWKSKRPDFYFIHLSRLLRKI